MVFPQRRGVIITEAKAGLKAISGGWIKVLTEANEFVDNSRSRTLEIKFWIRNHDGKEYSV